MSSAGTHYPVFFGSAGATLAITLTALGSSIGFGLCGVMVSSVGVQKPEIVMKTLIPVVMASVISIYGLVVSLLIARKVNPVYGSVPPIIGFKGLASGLAVGISGIAAGYTIGKIGQCSVFTYSKQPKFFIGMILMLIFGEVLGIFGLIVSMILVL